MASNVVGCGDDHPVDRRLEQETGRTLVLRDTHSVSLTAEGEAGARDLDHVGSYPTALQDLLTDFTEVLVTDEIRDAAAILPGSVRTLDAIHIASAQIIGDALAFLVSYDKRMLDVAHSVGIPIAAPGMSR